MQDDPAFVMDGAVSVDAYAVPDILKDLFLDPGDLYL